MCDARGSWLRPQQEANPFQLRERYVGEWSKGQRHGHGTFYLASGARYVGEWCANAKHGIGLFSFEDGSLYEGLFDADRMTDGQLRATSELYTYLDLTHLVPTSALESTGAAVRHILVRHNTDIKQVYRFYSSLGRVAEDAFNLTLSQFRTFAIDAQLVSTGLPISSIDDLVMRSSASQPAARPLPRPLVVATAVSGMAPSAGEAAEVRAANGYKRGGAHDGERTLLLREFVQGLVETAAAILAFKPPLVSSAEPSPTPPLALALLEMLQSLTSINPTPLDAPASDDALTTHLSAAVDTPNEAVATMRSRLQLAYGFYASTQTTTRFGKPPNEPILTVRALVQMLTDAELLPTGASVGPLLLATLPGYYLPAAAPPPAATAPAPAPAAEDDDEEEEGEEGAPADAAPAEPAEPSLTVEEVESLMDLKLIYSEFESTIAAFTRIYAAPTPPPWAPPPPPAEAEAPAEAPAEAAADAAAEGEVEADAEVEAAAPEAEEPAGPVDVLGAMTGEVLPKVGAFLLARLDTLGAAA